MADGPVPSPDGVLSQDANPYTAPGTLGEAPPGGPSFLRGNPTFLPALILSAMAAIYGATLLMPLIMILETAATGSRQAMRTEDVVVLLCVTLLVGAQLLILIGAVQSIRMRRHGWAMMGAVVAAIPGLTPCLLFGIPFAVWMILELRREDVKLKFRERDARAAT